MLRVLLYATILIPCRVFDHRDHHNSHHHHHHDGRSSHGYSGSAYYGSGLSGRSRYDDQYRSSQNSARASAYGANSSRSSFQGSAERCVRLPCQLSSTLNPLIRISILETCAVANPPRLCLQLAESSRLLGQRLVCRQQHSQLAAPSRAPGDAVLLAVHVPEAHADVVGRGVGAVVVVTAPVALAGRQPALHGQRRQRQSGQSQRRTRLQISSARAGRQPKGLRVRPRLGLQLGGGRLRRQEGPGRPLACQPQEPPGAPPAEAPCASA